jgi:uncharacterized GH25 family protein
MKKLITVPSFLILISFLSAQELWLQPAKFIYQWNEPVNIRFLAGENFEGENWNGDRAGVSSLEIYFNDAKDDISGLLSEETGDSIQFKVLDEGTAMVIFNSKNGFRKQVAATFSDYTGEAGVQNAIEFRHHQNETGWPEREFYQYCVKTIFQVGKRFNNTYRMETPLPLDIIPQQNPYQLKNRDSLQVKILFQKKPLAGQPVRVWHKIQHLTTRKHLITDENGMIKFPVEVKGVWMISTIAMTKIENDDADWLSYRGICTWGYE